MVAAAEQVGPIARFGNFEKYIVVAVERPQPIHHAAEAFCIFMQQVEVAGFAHVGMERDDCPQRAVDGTDTAHAAVVGRAVIESHVCRHLAVGREMVEERAQRGLLRGTDFRIV